MKCARVRKTTNAKLFNVISVIFLLLPVVSLVINPLLICVKYVVRISEGSMIWNMMQEEMEGVFVHCYLFNITNAEAFLAGDDENLRVEEVGPFTYQEYRRMEEQEIDENEGVMRFSVRNRARFVPERSIGDPREINVTCANLISLGVASKISSYPYLAKAGFNVLLNMIKSKPIINDRAYNVLWGHDDPLIKVGKNILPLIDFNSLGMLKKLFDPKSKTRIEMTVSSADKFRIKKVNNSTGIPFRGYDEPSKRTRCNTYEDTYEGMGFPPDFRPGMPIRLYRDIMCRLLDLQYVSTETLDYGPVVLKYRIDNNAYSYTNATKCLCQEKCVDGITDISPCSYGLGIGMSNAHFLHANPNIYSRIVGIHPDEEKHGSEFFIDSMTGMILKSRFTLQISAVVEDVSYNRMFSPFSNMVVPIAHFEITQPELPEDMKKYYSLLYNVLPYVIHGIEGILIIIGGGILAYTLRIKCRETVIPKRDIAYHIPGS